MSQDQVLERLKDRRDYLLTLMERIAYKPDAWLEEKRAECLEQIAQLEAQLTPLVAEVSEETPAT